jgi:radical SAM protein with 4Fe4S-binding SPASM domain
MFYRQRFDTFIRVYDDIGYIVNKCDSTDIAVSQSGAVFLSALNRNPQTLDELAEKIIQQFVDVDIEAIKKDVKDFYDMLENDGYIVSGETEEELNVKDIRFSYKQFKPKTINNDFTPSVLHSEKSTQQYLDEHFKNKPKLRGLQIELTSKCNERCIHCYIPHEMKTDEIEPELLYNILEQSREMGVLDLTLSGGEPMLHKNFCEFLRKCKEYDFSVTVLSNLTFLNDDIIAEMKANRISGVQVSLYSMKPEIHDEITQMKGSFEKTKNSILKLIENDIPLLISCPVMKQNKHCYVDVLKWANKYKVRTQTDFIMMARYDGMVQNLENRITLVEASELIQNIVENDPIYSEQIVPIDDENRDISNDIICGVCITSVCISNNGDVYPCPGWHGYVAGNVKESSLQDIWNNSEKVKYLRGLRLKDFPKCLKCKERIFCKICMVRNANEDPEGNPLNINEHCCKVAAINKEIVLDWRKKLQRVQ